MVTQPLLPPCSQARTTECLVLLELPSELLLEIFKQLPVPDILRCHSICQRIHRLLSTSAEVQYTIELYSSQQRENDFPSTRLMSISDRLELLKTVNANWSKLRFTRRSTLPYPFPSSYVYELSGGRLVLGSGTDTDGRNGTTSLNFYELPSREDSGNHGATIPHTRLIMDFPIADFAMDVTQNLLILLERTMQFGINVHIHTFDTNDPHPDAAKKTLHMPNQRWVTVHISGPILACLFADSGTDILMVWNWKTGEIIGAITGSKLRSFILLSSNHIGIANLDLESLDVYFINEEANSVSLVQRLLLPRVTGDEDDRPWTYDGALLRSHPNPRHSGQLGTSNPISQQAHLPFMTDESDGIIACTFHSATILNSFTLIMHRSALLRLYNEELPPRETTRNGIRERERLVPWSDWGPDNVRWLDVECSMRWICYVHGHRLAVLEHRPRRSDGRFEASSEEEEKMSREKLWPLIKKRLAQRLGRQSDDDLDLLPEEEEYFNIDDNQTFYTLRVFDFNPNHVRRAEVDETIAECLPAAPLLSRVNRGKLLVKEPTVMKGKIQTRLPYLDTTIKLRKVGLGPRRRRIEGVMMNAECVVIMMADRQFRTDGVEVLNV